jgi:hypothetical protein
MTLLSPSGFLKKEVVMLSSTLLVVSSLVAGQAEEPVSHYEHLKGLEFYVGEWVGTGQVSEEADRHPGAEVTVPVTIEWMLNKNVLVGNWKVMVDDKTVNQGKWLWWWDTKAKQIRALSVMTIGDYGESVWTKQGDKWIAKWTGAAADGEDSPSVLTTSVVGSDGYIHEWTQRKRGDKTLPDGRTDFKRVKPKGT